MLLSDLITDVLRQLVIISEIETPSAEQGQDAVTKLNDLMASLEADGIDLGYNPKATSGESIALPDGDKSGVKAMLGVRLAEGYGLAVPPVMAALADAWYKRSLTRALYATARESRLDNLPAGNAQPLSYNITTGSS
jgi:hypothetical protein